MSFQQSAQYLSRLGITPTIDVSTTDLPNLRTRQDVEALGEQGIEEMERYGYSRAYLQYQQALRLGLDESLPDLEMAGGAISRSIEEVAGDAIAAQANSAIHFVRGRTHPLIEQMGWADMEVNQLRDQLHLALGDAPNHQRGPILEALAAIENSGTGSMSMGISWDNPEPLLIYEVNSGDSGETDPYTTWRSNTGDGALGDLAIKPSINNSPLYSGITSMNPDGGGVYEVSSDWALQQAIASAASGGEAESDD